MADGTRSSRSLGSSLLSLEHLNLQTATQTVSGIWAVFYGANCCMALAILPYQRHNDNLMLLKPPRPQLGLNGSEL